MTARWRVAARRYSLSLYFVACLFVPFGVAAETLRIAVASNFAHAMTSLVTHFETDSGHDLAVSLGATGKHYAQISNGAPFDLFLAADVDRPLRLEREGRAIAGSRFTYAVGRLVAWAPTREHADLKGLIADKRSGRVAIANPRLAPYGRAARDALVSLGLWNAVESRLVRGENVGQAFQFVHSGNASVGLVAAAQLVALDARQTGSHWTIPDSLHTPLEQQAILLRDSGAGRAFLAFMRSETGRSLIRQAGYDLP